VRGCGVYVLRGWKVLKLLRYIKILRNLCFAVQYNLLDVIIPYASSVYLWLHIQSAVNMVIIVWIIYHEHIEYTQ
jgi:hypothetical protein